MIDEKKLGLLLEEVQRQAAWLDYSERRQDPIAKSIRLALETARSAVIDYVMQSQPKPFRDDECVYIVTSKDGNVIVWSREKAAVLEASAKYNRAVRTLTLPDLVRRVCNQLAQEAGE